MAESRNRSFAKLAKDVNTSGNIVASGISSSVSLGATIYATRANLPSSGNTAGDQAYVTGNNRLYIWTGSGWYNVALVNRAPAISSVTDSDGGTTPFLLSAQGLDTVITITAADSDGDPITYTATVDSDFAGLGTISQSDNVFTITPLGEDSATVTSATITFKADDGVNISSSINTFTLNFLSPLWNETVLSIGTSSTNSLDNSAFIDRSTNASTVTASGSPAQTAFHPYLDNWSVEFDGTGDYLTSSVSGGLGSGDFTIEFWYYYNEDGNGNDVLFNSRTSGTSGDGIDIFTNFKITTSGSVFLSGLSGSFLTAGSWNHAAIVRNSGTVYIYINGIEQDFASQGNNYSGTDFKIGGSPHGNVGYLNGKLSNFRVISGTALYTANFTLPTENLTAVSGTSLLTCQSNRFIDNSTNAHAITPAGNVKVSAFNPFGQGSEYALGENKGSVYSVGNASGVNVTGGSWLTLDSDFDISFWYYPIDITYEKAILLSTYYSSTGGWHIATIESGEMTVSLTGDGTDLTTSGAGIKNFSWHHIRFSRDSGIVKVHVNGNEVGNLSNSGTFAYSSTLSVGNLGSPTYNIQGQEGYISDLVFKRSAPTTFTPPTSPVGNTNADLYLPMDNAGIYDKTGNNTLTVYGNSLISTTQTKYTTTSIYFDGNGDYIRFAQNNSLILSPDEDFTIEGWVWLSSLSNTMEMFCMFAPPHHTIAISLNRGGSGNTWVLLGNGSSWNGVPAIDTGGTAPLGAQQWHHVALVKNGSTITIYHDANQAGQTTTSFATTTGNLILGAYELNGSFGEYLSGYIEGFQVLKGVAKYTSPGFTLPTQPQGRQYQAES